MIHPAIPRLASLCSQWGGALEIVDEQCWRDLFTKRRRQGYAEFPISHVGQYGVHWESKRVFVVADGARVQPVIHEMAHVFASLTRPDWCNEYAFLGWEIALARQVDAYAAWSRGMCQVGYTVENEGGTEWAALTRGERDAVIDDRLEHARRIGIVDENLRPRAIR